MAHSDLPYLDHAVKKMFDYQSPPHGLNRESLLECLTIGCNALKQLATDPMFHQQLESMAQAQVQNRDVYRSIVGNTAHFVHGFLQVEREALRSAGLRPELINFLLNDAATLRTLLLSTTIDPEGILAHVRLLQNWVCTAADQLRTGAVSEQQWQRSRQRARHATLGVGSTLIIALNASALAEMVGLSQAGSAVSTALGVVLLEHAIEQF